jgi:hypothetical protein
MKKTLAAVLALACTSVMIGAPQSDSSKPAGQQTHKTASRRTSHKKSQKKHNQQNQAPVQTQK